MIEKLFKGGNYMWVLFALLSAFFAAATSILAKLGIENINSNLATAIRTVEVKGDKWIMELYNDTSHLRYEAI